MAQPLTVWLIHKRHWAKTRDRTDRLKIIDIIFHTSKQNPDSRFESHLWIGNDGKGKVQLYNLIEYIGLSLHRAKPSHSRTTAYEKNAVVVHNSKKYVIKQSASMDACFLRQNYTVSSVHLYASNHYSSSYSNGGLKCSLLECIFSHSFSMPLSHPICHPLFANG